MGGRWIALLTLWSLACSVQATPSHEQRSGSDLTRLKASGVVPTLADSTPCFACHPDAASQWLRSAHAFSSFNNPIYRASVERTRAAAGSQATEFCAKCHDPALLADNAMTQPPQPDDPRAHAGIGCLVCHRATQATFLGNGSYELGSLDARIPQSEDTAAVQAHRYAMRPAPLSDGTLCASCHRSFLGAHSGNPFHQIGMDDVTAWQRSAYAGADVDHLTQVEGQRCQSCHMPRARATAGVQQGQQVHTHDFPGGHSWLAAMLGDGAPADRTLLDEAVELSVPRVDVGTVDDVGALVAGATVGFGVDEVVVGRGPEHRTVVLHTAVWNKSVGHRFPGGTVDVANTWLEADVRDRTAKLVARTARGEWHRFGVTQVDEAAQPVRSHDVFEFRAAVADSTIGPLDTALVRFALDTSTFSAAQFPLTVEVSLLHQTRDLTLQQLACDSARSELGRAYDAVSRASGNKTLDPCPEQPTTVLGRVRVRLLQNARTQHTGSRGQRLSAIARYAEGVLHELPERLNQEQATILAALGQAALEPLDAPSWILWLAKTEAQQGRIEPALRWLEQLEQRVGARPSIDAVRGAALSRVWRFSQAVPSLKRASAQAPRHDGVALLLSSALHNTGQSQAGLAVAQQAQRWQPLSEGLLRLEALSLGSPTALDRYLQYRAADVGPQLRARCINTNPSCRREVVAVHSHVLEVLAD